MPATERVRRRGTGDGGEEVVEEEEEDDLKREIRRRRRWMEAEAVMTKAIMPTMMRRLGALECSSPETEFMGDGGGGGGEGEGGEGNATIVLISV